MLAILSALALGACAPTEGEDGQFDVVETTNEDFDVSYVDVGLYPIVIGAADIDGTPDGQMEIAVSNRFDSSVTVLTEGLTVSETLPVGIEPTDVVFGNFDNANGLDLAVLNFQGQHLSIFLAAASGGWQSPETFNLQGAATQVSLIDLNGDAPGIHDLIVSVSGEAQLWAFVNNGSGNFTTEQTDTNIGPTRFLIGNYNSDLFPDLAVLNPPEDVVTVYLGDGAGGFMSPDPDGIPAKNYPLYLAEADFNDDGNADLAVVSRSESRVTILLGAGNGEFEFLKSEPIGGNADMIVSGAFDTAPSGPIDDLAIIHRGKRHVTLLFGDGSGDFEHVGRGVSEDPITLTQGFFNDDNCADLLTTEMIERVVSVLAGDCAGNFSRTVIGFTGAVSYPVVTDLDGNGTDDVVLVQKQSHRIVVLTNRH